MLLSDPSTFFDLSSYEHNPLFTDCHFVWEALGKLEPYLKMRLKQKDPAKTYPGAVLVNPDQIYIGQGTTVEAGAYIEGPCIIGNDCTIRHGAYVRGNVIAGNKCVIGHGTELKNAILLDHVHIAHLAYAGDSIFGNHCNLGAGVKCANLRFDGKEIILHHEGERFATGRRKFGVIAGDRVQLGCNSVTNPGTVLGKGCFLFPCTNFGGVAASESLIQLDAKTVVTSKTINK
jgi:UDP-N-acetylglucosamine diphosphorylase / glucose-1-phosphate thymidylyltransferase / UDP-N-acetylgalactosamine diphosphorylase / glucosamine-1-phosphate N-acetyltransferase / galactosamine-1-phosphate N-acetyltransferase